MECRGQDIAHLCSFLGLSTVEFGAPVWCHSVHTRLINSIFNDALHIVTGCLRSTPMEDLPVLAGIQPAELRQLGVILSLASPASHHPNHALHEQLVGQQNVDQGRLKSRRPFVLAVWKLLDSLSELVIHVKQWTKHKWNVDYLESISRVRAFIPRVSSKPLGKSLPRTSWVWLNCLQTGVGCFYSFVYKLGLVPSLTCECGATEQTADHVIS